MNKSISEIISKYSFTNLSDYFSAYRKIVSKYQAGDLDFNKKIKLAILSSSTVNGIKESLFVKCAQSDTYAEIYLPGYNQYAQEILNAKSNLYNSNPDIIFIDVDCKSIFGNDYFDPYVSNSTQWKNKIEFAVDYLTNLVEEICKRSNSKIVINNLEVPIYSPLGILENKEESGIVENIETINKTIRDKFKRNAQVFVFDYNSFCSVIGKENILDYKLYYLGDIKVKPQFVPNLADAYMRYIRAFLGFTKKCIVLDLDNTLWGGIIGENSLDTIHLGPTNEGKSFWEFQMALLALQRRGIILAINSKNNPSDALEVIRNHPYMILREQHFASIRINWINKVENLRSIAKELNIGLDSLIFIDDDPLNRALVSEFLPEVLVPALPIDTSGYLKMLMQLNLFDNLTITEEDKLKGEMYLADKKRREIIESTTDINEYLKMLNISVTIKNAKNENISRISQLTLKTNQFNTTTKRFTEENIAGFINSNLHLVLTVFAKDKFGDNGLTGVVIIEKNENIWLLSSFLLSCRILGRNIEDAVLATIIQMASSSNVQKLLAEFIPTKKNDPAKNVFSKSGFNLIENSNDQQIWSYDLKIKREFPDFISLNIEQ